MKRIVEIALQGLGAAALLLAAGCGKTTTFNDKVEGNVTIDGAPLAQVLVRFLPEADAGATVPESSGFTDQNGHFQLTHDRQKPGAAVGKHRVIVLQGRGGVNPDDPQAPPVPPPPGPKVPPVYTLAGKTPLLVDVTAGRHDYDLSVSTKATAGAPAAPKE